jgi:hypothetical protein
MTGVVVVGRIDFVAEVMVGDGWECGIVVEVVVAGAKGFGCVARVVDWCWIDAAIDRAEAFASAPIG